ncbi:uncharacterized protein LOC111866644 [Cryptotermes secundus]|uniref:uncharacterized protein LOC111866644 n=1 Tax=Cryptotermes secundus TaxID=105785 RepID=UPI000CD7C32F|nr:uncharacterized protein LOC111866644 [Cryptotermes secundus]
MSRMSQIEESRGSNLIRRGREHSKHMLVEKFMTITGTFQAVALILETRKLSEIPEDELEYFPKIFSWQHRFMVKLMEKWCEAEDNIEAKTEIIHALQKELTLERGAARDPAMIKIPRYSLQETQHKTDLINTDINSLEYQANKTERDALKLEVGKLQSLCEQGTGLSELLNNVMAEREKLTQERKDLLFVSKSQVTDMKAMQRDNEALKRKIEFLEGQCNNAEALKRRLKTVTAEHQRQKKVRNDMQLEMERMRGQCKDNAALKVDRD